MVTGYWAVGVVLGIQRSNHQVVRKIGNVGHLLLDARNRNLLQILARGRGLVI